VRPPVIAFGTGGSGTRAVAAIMREAGVYLGPRLNRALDAVGMRDLRPTIERYLRTDNWMAAMAQGASAGTLPPPPAEVMAQFEEAVAGQREGIPSPDAPWGWKTPRSMYLLPVAARLFDGLIAIHLVRDGRDMAYSPNQQQAEAYRELLVPELADAPLPVASAGVWARANVAAARFGRQTLGERYLLVRYEDLCADPPEWASRVLRHVGVRPTRKLRTAAAGEVRPSASAERWREAPEAEQRAIAEAAAEGLREFGYA
jgi:hypothetical protein